MNKRFWGMLSCLFALLLALYLCCFNKSSGMTAKAALPSDGKYLTSSEMRSILGDSITGRYYNGSAYVDVTYRYLHSELINQLQQQTSSDIVKNNLEVVVYAADISSVGLNPSYITFDLQPEFQLLNTNYIYSFIGHNMSTGISASVYSPPRWEWFLNGRTTVFQDANLLNPNGTEYAHFRTNNSVYYTYAEMSYVSNETISGYSLRASFFGNNPQSTAKLAIGLPYVSSSATGESGTAPTGVTTQQPSYTVIVSVDNAGVESGLNDVVDAVDGLENAILDDGDYDYGDVDDVIEGAPSAVDYEAIEDAMSKADTILDDIPSIIATGAFWMNLAKDLVNDDDYIVIVPVCILLSFIVYIWWKK